MRGEDLGVVANGDGSAYGTNVGEEKDIGDTVVGCSAVDGEERGRGKGGEEGGGRRESGLVKGDGDVVDGAEGGHVLVFVFGVGVEPVGVVVLGRLSKQGALRRSWEVRRPPASLVAPSPSRPSRRCSR
jgi:hypothetical protein